MERGGPLHGIRIVELAGIGPAVSVFGSARTRPQDADYQAAENAGRLACGPRLTATDG